MELIVRRCQEFLSQILQLLEPRSDATPERIAQSLKLVDYILGEAWDTPPVRSCLLVVKAKLTDAMNGSVTSTRLVNLFNTMGMVRADHMALLALVDAAANATRECIGKLAELERKFGDEETAKFTA